jgi:5-hydroxyisourate hydrolase
MARVSGQIGQAMGRLTTHVLDTAQGKPAAGMSLRLYRNVGERYVLVTDAVTNADGRCDAPLLEGDALSPGRYRLVFSAGDYFAAHGDPLPDPPFVDLVTIDFGVADAAARWHVPLLVSPWAWSTYRGS